MKATMDEFVRGARWYVQLDDVIGGWIVATADKPASQLDHNQFEFTIAEVMTKEIGQYICDLHNTKTWFRA